MEVPGGPKLGLRIGNDFRFHEAQRHHRPLPPLLSDTDQPAAASILAGQAVEDDSILRELRRPEDNQVDAVRTSAHFVRKAAMARRAFPRWEMAFFSSSPSSAAVMSQPAGTKTGS